MAEPRQGPPQTAPTLQSLQRRMFRVLSGAGTLTPVEAPLAYLERSGTWKGGMAQLSGALYRAPGLARVRLALVQAPELAILNVLALPEPESPAPIFGADLVRLPGRAHMAAADLSPCPADPRHALPWLESLAEVADRHRRLPRGGELPEWARRVFSPYPLYTRYPAGEERAVQRAVLDYLALFVALVRTLPPDPSRREAGLAGLRAYAEAHRLEDRGLTLLGRMFGEEWAAAYLNEFLFPDPS